MSTKINTEYYGAEENFVTISDYAKCSPFSLATLMTNSTYTSGALDVSAAPWGIGKSSASSDMSFVAARGASWSIYKMERSAGNTPLYLYKQPATYAGANSNAELVGSGNNSENYEKALFRCRLSPSARNNGNNLLSALAIDTGTNITIANVLQNTPITYLDYQYIRAQIEHVYYKPVDANTILKCTMDDIANNTVSVDRIVYFDYVLKYKNNLATGIHCSIGGNETEIPGLYKAVYYDDEAKFVRPCRYIDQYGYWYIDTNYYSADSFRYGSSDYFAYESAWEELGNYDFIPPNPVNCGWNHALSDYQNFDGLIYHWEYGLTAYSSNQWLIDPIETGDTYASGTYRSFCYMVVDEIPAGMTQNEAYFAAILHEVAFLGFPIVCNSTAATHDFGEDDVYLPVFDNHLITTGEYQSGETSTSLINAAWSDIFGVTMPEYDPEYDPTPQPEPGQDGGDITNTTLNRFSNAGGLKQYVLSEAKLIELTAFLNGTYLPTSADLDADFKGTNPQDYIVSVQKYPFDIEHELGDPYIYVGKINTGITAKALYPSFAGHSSLPINSRCTFDFGTIYINPNDSKLCYGDFRDFQSKLLLFMPFVGTVELDPRLYIAHTVGLIYTIDYNTGSVAAEIKRDGLTMETKTSTISITIPFMAANMGAYQNQLAQLDYSKQMTKIKGIQAAVSTAFQIGSAAQGVAATGSAPGLGQLSAIASGAVQLAANATQLSQIDYQIEHTAPNVGTLSTASAANSFFMDPRARLVIIRPEMLAGYSPSQYAHTIGHACCKTGTLSQFHGYTVAATAVLDDIHTKTTLIQRQATEQEKQLLRRALQNGIYL